MHILKFYPVGNGDTSQIILENGKRMLFDFRHLETSEDNDTPHINLKEQLRNELAAAERDDFDVVAFTHGDKDHIANSTTFFELRHAAKYQGKGRIKIRELWVPAAMILETASSDNQSDEYVVWRQEARYRLKQGQGIRVFSKPDKLKDWLEGEGLSVDDRRHLITDAGQLVPGFSLPNDGIEFFCHSPFIKHTDEGDDLRNAAALIFQVRFMVEGTQTDYWAVGDTESEIIEDIVRISKYHGNEDRLNWDILNNPHHCSYLALSDEKGEKETVPAPLVKTWLEHGNAECYIISSSNPIRHDQEAYEQTQPPHIQAKNCYLRYLHQNGGRRMLVTMEEPNTTKPEPIVIEITGGGHNLKTAITGAGAIISEPALRAGSQ